MILDAARGELRPLYDHMKHLPDIGDIASPPFFPVDFVRRTIGNVTSFDAGRGCPFQCSFCTIINVQGRKSRYRSPNSVEQIIRMNYDQGVNRFFITDDNFARNKDWEAIYDRIIKLREEDGLDIRFCIQVDTLCHRIPNFIDKSRRAGVTRVHRAREHQSRQFDRGQEAAEQDHRVPQDAARMETGRHHDLCGLHSRLRERHAGDDPHDLEIIKKELPLDMLEDFHPDAAAGLGGPQGAVGKGRVDGPRHEQIRRRARRHRPSQDERSGVEEAYRTAWGHYYTDDHLETIVRRAYASGINIRSLMPVLFWFSSAVPVENLHPLQWGIFRVKYRHDRRSGLPLGSPLLFYGRYAADIVRKVALVARRWRHLKRIVRKVEADPHAKLIATRR